MRKFFLAAIGLAMTSFALPAQAVLVGEETFTSYTAGSNIIGANGGTGWNGSWQAGNTNGSGFSYLNTVRNDANVLTGYAGYNASTTPASTGGNYLNLAGGFGGPAFNFAQRNIDVSSGGTYGAAGLTITNAGGAATVGADNKTVWGSFLYQGNGSLGSQQIYLRNLNSSAGLSNPDAVFNIPAGGGGAPPPTKLYLFRIDYLSGNDAISIWSSPNLTSWTEATTPTATATGNFQFNQLIFVTDGNEWRFDDVRLGTSASDVIPVPEPATASILGLAGLLLMRRRRTME